jgi:hypothetical protein
MKGKKEGNTNRIVGEDGEVGEVENIQPKIPQPGEFPTKKK